MSITSITRDWGIVPCIVRILSTDSLAAALAPAYLTAQLANTDLANVGTFEWLATDSVLVCASDGSALCTVSADFSSLVAASAVPSVANGLTAHAGGGQANALQLAAAVNRVTTVATAADSVKLPAALAQSQCVVINATANSMNVYSQSSDSINSLGGGAPLPVGANKAAIFYCAVDTVWNSVLSA